MKRLGFSLKPFPSADLLPGRMITGEITRRSNLLSVSYELSFPPGQIAIPGKAGLPVRRNALWEDTCFEFFLAPENSEHYWEFNLSPAGHWNVYRFASCRADLREEEAFSSLPFDVQALSEALHLSIEIDLNRIIPADRALRAGITAVLKDTSGTTTYWALAHPGPKPDFHLRESFLAELPATLPAQEKSKLCR